MSVRLGRNIKATLSDDGKYLTLRINLSKKPTESKTGKSMVYASSGSAFYFDNHISKLKGFGLNMNLFKIKSSKSK